MTLAIHEPSRTLETTPSAYEQVRRLIERLAFEANRTAKSFEPESVHDLRVATRRVEQAFITFKVHFPRKPVKRLRKQLKAVLCSAGALRDHDIAAKILSKTRQPGATQLLRRVSADRKDAEKALLLILKRLSLRTRISKWCDDLGLNAPGRDFDRETVERIAVRTMPELGRRFFRAGEAAVTHSSGEKLHDFRILTKKFRYTLELFVPIYGPNAEEWTRDLRSVQSVLGDINDYRTVLSMATELGCGKKLKSALQRSERRKIRKFRDTWAERFSGPAIGQWMSELRNPADSRSIPHKAVNSSTAIAAHAAAAHG